VDLVSAVGATDHAELAANTARFQAVPGAVPVFYQVGPPLLYAGLVALAALLAAAGRLRWWQAGLVLVGAVAPVISLDVLPLGALALLAGFGPLLRRRAPAAVPA
jgi:hypothetical protein